MSKVFNFATFKTSEYILNVASFQNRNAFHIEASKDNRICLGSYYIFLDQLRAKQVKKIRKSRQP